MSSSDEPGFPLPYISVILVACLLLITGGILLTLFICYKSSPLHSLPKEISWSFMDSVTRPLRWEYSGNSKSGYYSRSYSSGGKDFKRVTALLNSFFQNGSKLVVDEIIAIYNKNLTVSFINQWHTTLARYRGDYSQFFYTNYQSDESKVAVIEAHRVRQAQFPYKHELEVPLMPVLHGTDFHVAEKIAQTGFASLSSLDSGYYGKGIYFTTHLLYTLPYCLMKRNPAVIISYINMGNIYPVTEPHRLEGSLMGQALKNGYNAHYIITDKHGDVIPNFRGGDDDSVPCDEIVVNQEVQILPAFIICLNYESCISELKHWERTLNEKDSTIVNISLERDNDGEETGLLVDRI